MLLIAWGQSCTDAHKTFDIFFGETGNAASDISDDRNVDGVCGVERVIGIFDELQFSAVTPGEKVFCFKFFQNYCRRSWRSVPHRGHQFSHGGEFSHQSNCAADFSQCVGFSGGEIFSHFCFAHRSIHPAYTASKLFFKKQKKRVVVRVFRLKIILVRSGFWCARGSFLFFFSFSFEMIKFYECVFSSG